MPTPNAETTNAGKTPSFTNKLYSAVTELSNNVSLTNLSTSV